MHACKSPLAVYNMVESGREVSNKEKQKLPQSPFPWILIWISYFLRETFKRK
jgi:hypothetical protein